MRGLITVQNPNNSAEQPKEFTYDFVFGPDSKQVDLYNQVARPIVENVIEGYNGESFYCSFDYKN